MSAQASRASMSGESWAKAAMRAMCPWPCTASARRPSRVSQEASVAPAADPLPRRSAPDRTTALQVGRSASATPPPRAALRGRSRKTSESREPTRPTTLLDVQAWTFPSPQASIPFRASPLAFAGIVPRSEGCRKHWKRCRQTFTRITPPHIGRSQPADISAIFLPPSARVNERLMEPKRAFWKRVVFRDSEEAVESLGRHNVKVDATSGC